MNTNYLILNIFALLVLIILSIAFFSRKRSHKIEDNLYGGLLIISIFTITFGILLGWLLDKSFNNVDIVIKIFNKVYLIGLTLLYLCLHFIHYVFQNGIISIQKYLINHIIYFV